MKRALLVGIDQYASVSSLRGCVADARAMAVELSRHADNALNFDCRVLVNPGSDPITRAALRKAWGELFDDFAGDVIFYFSGHGTMTETGGFLVTHDGAEGDPGLPMDELVQLANKSKATTVLFIIDSCFSGNIGNPANMQSGGSELSFLKKGVTILAASKPSQVAKEVGGHGVFTKLVLGALRGGAADVRGRVSAASIYAYVEAALGGWDQRPIYKSHADQLDPVRLCEPKVSDAKIRQLADFFPEPDHKFPLDMTHEETSATAIPAHVETFKIFKEYQIAGLLRPETGNDLYWTAEQSRSVHLTALGQFYLELVRNGRL